MNRSTAMFEAISDTEFEEKVLQNGNRPTLIIFGADWSGTYQMLQNVIGGVASDFSDKMDFYQIDIEENPDYANMMNIREVPSVFIFCNGDVVDHFSGLHSKRRVRTRLEQAVNIEQY